MPAHGVKCTTMDARTLLVDATHVLGRAFFTTSPERQAPDGSASNALFALAGALRRAFAFKTPTHAVALLEPAPEWPAELLSQHARLAAFLEAHGVRVLECAEAAPLIAGYTAAALEAGGDVVIVGSDKRLAQLVGARVWWYDAFKDLRYTPELVYKRFGVGPGFVAGWLALVGDQDRLPGVKGLGKTGVTRLVEAHGSVEAALADPDAVEGRSAKALRRGIDLARNELRRATLVPTRPREPLGLLAFEAPSSLNALYAELGFHELLQVDTEAAPVPVLEAEALAPFLASLSPPVALYALTEDPSPIRGALAGLALSDGSTRGYLPMPPEGCPLVLAEWLADDSIGKLGHDLKGTVLAFARRGVQLKGVVGDSGMASHLAQPSAWAPHDLPVISRVVLQRALPEDDSARGVGRRRRAWAKVPTERAAAFAGQRAETSLAVWEALEPTTPREQLTEYQALTETLIRMELKGIACDAEDLARAGEDFAHIRARLEAEIFSMAGGELNLGSSKQLRHLLYETLGLPVVMRTKTGWSTANAALERLEHAHPIVGPIMRWRRLRRLQDSWINTLTAAIDPDGRVRSTFSPARSFSGRLVNAAPDLGRVPGRTPEMARIRHAITGAPGCLLLSVDYDQLGLYVLAHLSQDPALIEPLLAKDDMHTLTAMAALDLPREAITKRERQMGKVTNFATFAGQGASALALQLGVTAAEAKAMIARFDVRYAKVRAYQDEQERLARERGYIETIAGRRWPIEHMGSNDHQMRSYGVRLARRATHEGSVADVCRRSLLCSDQALRAAGLRTEPLLQIADEVLFEVPEEELEEAAALISEAMRHAFELTVPLQVGCKAGPNWAELAPL